jgi:hypothetical protein
MIIWTIDLGLDSDWNGISGLLRFTCQISFASHLPPCGLRRLVLIEMSTGSVSNSNEVNEQNPALKEYEDTDGHFSFVRFVYAAPTV